MPSKKFFQKNEIDLALDREFAFSPLVKTPLATLNSLEREEFDAIAETVFRMIAFQRNQFGQDSFEFCRAVITARKIFRTKGFDFLPE